MGIMRWSRIFFLAFAGCLERDNREMLAGSNGEILSWSDSRDTRVCVTASVKSICVSKRKQTHHEDQCLNGFDAPYFEIRGCLCLWISINISIGTVN